MPSASKKRKSAKSKKAKEAKIDPSSNGQQGSDDLKSQDERGNDAGGVSDFETVGLVKTKENNVVKIDRELKSGESYDGQHDSIESAKSAEKSNDGNKILNATSTYAEKDSAFKSQNSIQEISTSKCLRKSSDFAPEKTTLLADNTPYKGIDNSGTTESTVSKEKSSNTDSSLLEESAVDKVGAANLGMKRNDDKVCPFSDENARVTSLEVSKHKECDIKLPKSSYGSPIPESTNAIEHVKDSLIPECSEDQPPVASRLPVQKTSWLNCCGLFEWLGSNK